MTTKSGERTLNRIRGSLWIRPRYMSPASLISALLMLLSAPFAALAAEPSSTDSPPSTSSPAASTDTTPPTLQEVMVTGSRLSSPSVQYASPVTVLSPEEILAGGATTIDAALTALPQVVASQDQFSGDGDGLSTVNLRGLGTSRTLVLVDGRRYIAADYTQVVDLNTIPEALIERVDVVTGGRSAVYGSDAIAGVVNFILKKDFSGFETEAHYGETQYGDGGDLRLSTVLGINSESGRGNLTLFGEYSKRDAVLSIDRAYAATALQDSPNGAPLIPGGSSAIIGGRLSGLGNSPSMMFLPNGTLLPYDGSFYNYNPNLDLQVPSDRRIVGAMGHYQLAPSVTVYEEAEFIDIDSYTTGPPNPGFGTPVTLQVNSPFFPASTQSYLAQFDTTGSGYVNAGLTRRWVEFGNEVFNYDRQALRTVTGLRGDIAAGWTYDGYFNYSTSNGYLYQPNSLSQSRLQNALDTAFLDPATGATSPYPFAGLANGGQLVCANAFARAEGCVPANVFGAGNMSPASIAYLAEQASQNESATTEVANLTITNNEIADIPTGGPVAADAGVEWRREAANFVPDWVTSTGDTISATPSGPVSGSYNVKEGFLEVNADLIRDLPGVHLLSANVAARESDYSITTTGSVLSWSGGLAYQPLNLITLRAQYQRATRAPNINDLYGALSIVQVPGVDPCNSAPPGSALAARCIATGVPAALIGTVINPNTQVNDEQGGSSQLQAEVSNTYTTGVIIRPIPSANITVDYFDIDISRYITNIGAENVLDLCYELNLSNYCSRIVRSPIAGDILYVDDSAANSGGYKTSGFDLGVQWQPTLGGSTFNISSQATYVIDRTLTPVAAIPSQVDACAGRFGVICGNPAPKWKAVSTASWTDGPVTVTGQWQLIGPVSDDGGLGIPLAVEHIGGVNYFNLNASYAFAPSAVVTLGIVNLTNRLPPIMGDNSDANWANSWPATYDTIGRRFFVDARYKF